MEPQTAEFSPAQNNNFLQPAFMTKVNNTATGTVRHKRGYVHIGTGLNAVMQVESRGLMNSNADLESLNAPAYQTDS